ncbi:OadG family protein [Thermococcus gammatolerans]|uniref:Methylmalonyl-CoA decarboxylase, delta subunit (MmdD) n=1 Tax=Thermococcus gammatolerans (strain DSM 15229 / JCM 11827 / EJ3) TaxID=593117 RepID=C5A2B0_THEGJ|nr:OadG family protein [Thermococcus gammatolerans]ACS34529.1 Methylmalonyl-CoA decarboxylase, delta subunit (MmdD) [Thermococcus gammatolerans EJ3]
MSQFAEGGWITIIGITVVFAILAILAIVMYAIGAFERGMTKKVEKEEKAVEETKEEVETPEEEIPPRDLAVITASILAYLAKKAEVVRPLPFRRKVSDAWRLYGLQSGMDEVENFNYEMRKW